MSKICQKCNSIIKDEHKFCTNCGAKLSENIEEQLSINDKQNNSDKKENVTNYDKIGGFLIFIGIILILGLIQTIPLIEEYYSNEYLESMKILYSQNNELYNQFNISYYLILSCLFSLILLNISFFTKSNLTKETAIGYFILLVITDAYSINMILNNKEMMDKLSIEVIKMIFQILILLLFIVYFFISKRVKGTFIIERNFGLYTVISIIIPVILFFYYANKLDEIKQKSIESINQLSTIQQNNLKEESTNNITSEINNYSPEEKFNLLKEAKNDFDLKDYYNSILKFKKLLALNYRPAEVNFYLGQNWYMKKKYDIAISHYKKSAMLNEKASYMPTLLLNSAISFENVKDMENAKSFYDTLIELYPSSNETKEAKEKLSNIKNNNTINQNISNNTDKMFLIESLECNGQKIKLMSKYENNSIFIHKDDILLFGNEKSIKFEDINVSGDLHTGLKCKKINGENQLIISATAGNSWSGHYSFSLKTLKANELNYETEIKLGLIKAPTIEKLK